MTPSRLASFCVLLASAGVVSAGVHAELVGVWMGVQGGTAAGVAFQVNANGSCVIGQQTGRCQTTLGSLRFTGPRGLSRYSWKVREDELTISSKGALPMVFRRMSNAPPAIEQPAEGAPTAFNAGPYTHPQWGLSLVIPQNWTATVRDWNLVLGSDVEPGLMIVQFMRGATRETLLEDFNTGLQEGGVSLMPVHPAEEFPAKSKRLGFSGDLGGMGQNGVGLRARVVGVLSAFGDAAFVVGVTTQEQYPTLKARVDALAASVAFAQPGQ